VFIDLRTLVVKKKRILHCQLFKSNRIGYGVVIIVKYKAQASNFKEQDKVLQHHCNGQTSPEHRCYFNVNITTTFAVTIQFC